MINYIIYSSLSLGFSLLIYRRFLKNQKTFQFNRFYLLATLALCLLAPFVELEFLNPLPNLPEIHFLNRSDNLVVIETGDIGRKVETIYQKKHGVGDVLFYIYVMVASLLLVRYLLNLFKIIRLTHNKNHRIGAFKIIAIDEQSGPASFFNYLFINCNYLEGKDSSNILKHEVVHCKQLHSLDILIIELASCFVWFNLFVWLYKREIRENHEYIADAEVIRSGVDLESYSNSIISSGIIMGTLPFASGFNFNHIKNRLMMLHQPKSKRVHRFIKSGMALICFALVFSLSSFKDRKPQLTVVVDAGHGGHDSGNLSEKDIVLQISQKIAHYSDEKIKIIETRDADQFLSLAERVKAINTIQPDLVISLHCNASENIDAQGVEAFYYDKNNHHQKSYEYSKMLIQKQLNQFSERGEIKNAGFYILKNVECPAVLLELGFITNSSDLAKLTDAEHQEKIAKGIYESLLEIRNYKAD